MCQKIKKAMQLIYDRGRRRLHHNQSQNLTHTFLGDLMDKRMEVAAGKKNKGEGDLSSAGGNYSHCTWCTGENYFGSHWSSSARCCERYSIRVEIHGINFHCGDREEETSTEDT
jgi:hypothetical protein